MPEQYPIPSYACTLWVEGDNLRVAFPPQGPEERGSSITLPAHANGLATVIKILRDRAQAKDRRLGTAGTPSQYEVERAMAHDKCYAAILGAMAEDKAERRAEREEAGAFLKELGL